MTTLKTNKLTLADIAGSVDVQNLNEVPYLVQGRPEVENFYSHVKKMTSKGAMLGSLFLVNIPAALSDLLSLVAKTPMYNAGKPFNLLECYAERCARQMLKIIDFWNKNPCSDQREYREAVASLCKEFAAKYPNGKLNGQNPFVCINEVIAIHSISVIGPWQFMSDQEHDVASITRQLNQKRLVQEMLGELVRTLIWEGLDITARAEYRDNRKQERVLVDFYEVFPYAVLPEQSSAHIPKKMQEAKKQDARRRPDGHIILDEISRYLHESVRDGALDKRPYTNGYSSLYHLLQSVRVIGSYLVRHGYDENGMLKFPDAEDEDIYQKMSCRPLMLHILMKSAQDINKPIAGKNIKHSQALKRQAEAIPTNLVKGLLTQISTAAIANSKEMKQTTAYQQNAIGSDTAYEISSLYLLQLITLMCGDMSHGQMFVEEATAGFLM